MSVLTKGDRIVRVTEEVKNATRRRILDAARELFTTLGFAQATTRDLARAARIASGTLFNYFPSKEAIATDLVDEALRRGEAAFGERADEGRSLDEDLFAYVAAGLRALRPCRCFVRAVLETGLGPIARPPPGRAGSDEEATAQARHLETVYSLAVRHGHDELSPMSLQLYWTLYTGVLTFWSDDASPHQEDSLALLDQSLRMFVGWLAQGSDGPDAPGDAPPRAGDAPPRDGGDDERTRN